MLPPHALRLAALLLSFTLGCALWSRAERPEPGILVVRNKSGADVVELSLVDAAPGDRAVRHGSIAPVPRGVSQVVVRPRNPPPLATEVDVSWTEASGVTHEVRLDLDEALYPAGVGGPDLALVFELLPGGELRAHTELRSVGAR